MKKIGWLLLLLAGLSMSCSSGGSSSGSGGNVLSSTATYAKEDLAGNWSFTAREQGGSSSCSGTMTFDKDVHLVGITNGCCPSGQLLSQTEFWFWNYGYVKGRNYAWCANPAMLTKYSLDFSDKRTIRGLMDVHESHKDGDRYVRYDIVMTSQTPVVQPVNPETSTRALAKKPVQTVGRINPTPQK
jgi:hypothetical protein